jgi:hypothetical protein
MGDDDGLPCPIMVRGFLTEGRRAAALDKTRPMLGKSKPGKGFPPGAGDEF